MTSYKQNNKRRTKNKKKRTPITILSFTFYLIPKNGAHISIQQNLTSLETPYNKIHALYKNVA